MGLDTRLLKTVLIWVMAAATTRSASEAEITQTIRADCQYKCGEVSIPYPFGTSEGCYLNNYFLITCNTSYNPPKPFLVRSNVEVQSISLDGQLRIHTFVAVDCFNQNGTQGKRLSSQAISPFPFSMPQLCLY
ncbi:hypothetical protein CerSpe_047550 [Prunus speciosa]